MQDMRQLMSDAKFYGDYSRYIDTAERYESWDESVSRVMTMHKEKYATEIANNTELGWLVIGAEEAYKGRSILGAQRGLQFGGEQLLKHNLKIFNCVSTHLNRVAFFQEYMYMLLCGAGAGFSVQKHHVAQLPRTAARTKHAKIHVIEDSIEGWADAIGVLLSSYFEGDNVTFPQYQGQSVLFEYSLIRQKGAYISGGFQAPGPKPLRKAIEKIEAILEANLGVNLRPIHVYDISMHIADAVMAGGVRRAATSTLFSFDDLEMIRAKTGDWFTENPQRARSNNSAVILRDTIQWEEFNAVMTSVEQFGEPGFVFTDDTEIMFNPCFEIAMLPVTLNGVSGWQGCNLVEMNGGQFDTPEKFYEACKYAAVLGTLQAGYTNFPYLPKATQEIFEGEALLGVSVTGWMANPDVLFDEEVMARGAAIVVETNKLVAQMIGINQAARTTTVKPSGNASVLLMTPSGIHGDHAPNHIRNVQMNKESAVVRLIEKHNPDMVEQSLWGETDDVISFPIVSPGNALFKKDLLGITQLEYVKKVQMNWIENGTNVELCRIASMRHNVSNTITVTDWEETARYVFDNRNYFCGIAFIANTGDKDYVQAPFTEVLMEDELVEKYGVAAIFASGLIVDGLNLFNNDIWHACNLVTTDKVVDLSKHANEVLSTDWIRRAKQFAVNYFDGDTSDMCYCLKDVYTLHRWHKILGNHTPIDWKKDLSKKGYVDVDTLGGVACAGGACEISF